MRRRKLLAGIASASTIPVLAGCLTGDEEDDDGENDDPDNGDGNESNGDNNESNGDGNESDGDGNESAGDGNESRNIETLSQETLDDPAEDERNVESTATVSGDAETVEIEGTLEAPTPCHEAVIADVSIEDDTMTVHVELEKSSDGDACTQQISEVEYSATITVEEGDPTHVVVLHTDRLREETAADTEL